MPARKDARSRSTWADTGAAQAHKIAATIGEASEILALPVAEVERLARQVVAYRHNDGSLRWPVKELTRVLADAGRVVGPE